jgi:hypothetical protein
VAAIIYRLCNAMGDILGFSLLSRGILIDQVIDLIDEDTPEISIG